MVTAETIPAYGEALRAVKGSPHQLLIDGRWVDPVDGGQVETEDPATGAAIASVAHAGRGDVDRAVRAARSAFEDGRWSGLPPSERTRILLRIADLIEDNAANLAMIEVLDLGTPMVVAELMVAMSAEAFRYYAGWCTKLNGALPPVGPEKLVYLRREPVGVCAQIIPWNAPLVMASWKIAPALVCGNTLVLKPAEQTPLTALRLGAICLEAGVPPGVVNIISGDGAIGAALVSHPQVDKVAFTGSVDVGKQIMAESARSMKRVTLELGGKSPNIVFQDAPIEDAVTAAMMGIFTNSGQMCTAGSRLFIQAEEHDRFLEQLIAYTQFLKVGHGLCPDTMIGPLVSARQRERVKEYIEIGREEGAELVLGGRCPEEPGYFVEPTIFAAVSVDMRIAQEEIFGPVLSVIPFRSIDEIVRATNDTPYGLAAAVWTRDLSTAHQMAAKLRAGTVWVNCYNEVDPAIPFGGFRESGIGRELGEASLDAYSEWKSVVIAL